MVGLFKHPKRRLKKFIKDGEYNDAIIFGKNLESKYYNDPDFMFIMGSIYYILEDSEKALPYFEKSFELNDSDVETLRLKTNVHLALEQKEEALDCCYRILKIDKNNSESQDLIKELESI